MTMAAASVTIPNVPESSKIAVIEGGAAAPGAPSSVAIVACARAYAHSLTMWVVREVPHAVITRDGVVESSSVTN
jgi:hypothetical protein